MAEFFHILDIFSYFRFVNKGNNAGGDSRFHISEVDIYYLFLIIFHVVIKNQLIMFSFHLLSWHLK